MEARHVIAGRITLMLIAGVVGECHPAAADVDFNTFRGHVAVLDQPLERGTADLVVASTVGSL